MNARQLIYTAITGVTGTTNISYNHFPDSFDSSSDTGLIFTTNNPDNQNSFDVREFIKTYNVDFTIRSPSLSLAESIREELKPIIYNLESTQYISYVLLVSEDSANYDNDLKTWEVFLSFDLTA